MSKIYKIIKIFGFFFLFFPIFFLFFLKKLCYTGGVGGGYGAAIGCAGGFIMYSFFSILLSILFFSISHILKKRAKREKILIRRNNKNLIIKIIGGFLLVGFGFLFHYFKKDGPDAIFVIVGTVVFLMYSIELVINLFSKKQNDSHLDS